MPASSGSALEPGLSDSEVLRARWGCPAAWGRTRTPHSPKGLARSSRCAEEEGPDTGLRKLLPRLWDRRALAPDSPRSGVRLSLAFPSLSGKDDAKLEERGGGGARGGLGGVQKPECRKKRGLRSERHAGWVGRGSDPAHPASRAPPPRRAEAAGRALSTGAYPRSLSLSSHVALNPHVPQTATLQAEELADSEFSTPRRPR